MSSDFVTPQPHRLTLHDGKFVDIQKVLNHGDTEDLHARIWPSSGGGMDRRMVRTARILAYLLGWSLTKIDAETKLEVPVPYSLELPEQTRLDTIRALNHERAVEIYEAIDAHEAAMAKDRDAKKKIRAGAPVSDPTSPSPSAVDGRSASLTSVA